MEYSVIIKGTRAEFEQIPPVAQQVLEDYKAAVEKAQKSGGYYGWDSTWHYESLAEEIAEIAKSTLEEGGDPLVMELESSDTDDTHGDFEAFLDGLDHKIPGLAIAVYATYVDTEYGEGDENSIYFSPSGTSKFKLGGENTGCLMVSDKLPDEDWLPYGWRHPEEKAPAAKAEGTVALLGDWGKAEASIVDKALMGDALKAMGYKPFQHASEAVTKTDDGWMFRVGGEMDAGETAQNLHLALLRYLNKGHKRSYAALCKTMREKKLAIHLYLDESTGPNAAWSYCNNSAWHFLITSDGARLVSKFTWCGTYGFGSRGGTIANNLYEQASGKKWDDLSKEAKFLAAETILAYGAKHEPPAFPDIPDWILEEIGYGVEDYEEEEDYEDEDDCEDEEDYEDEYDEAAEAKEEIAEYEGKMKVYCTALSSVIDKALAHMPDLTPPVRFIPQTFDQRFAEKTFIVKGDLDGYTEGQVQEIIEKFGGKVGKNVTAKTVYFVCGSGVGDSFKTALKHGTPFLSADYFEDLTR